MADYIGLPRRFTCPWAVTHHFVYLDANCGNRLLMAEYCYCGDDWRTIGCFSGTAGLLLCSEEGMTNPYISTVVVNFVYELW